MQLQPLSTEPLGKRKDHGLLVIVFFKSSVSGERCHSTSSKAHPRVLWLVVE